MINSLTSRRRFIQAAALSSLAAGSSIPKIASSATPSLQNKILMSLRLSGGPDFRHLIVPAYDSAPDSFGNKYWQHRRRSHGLSPQASDWQRRWEEDYFPITVGGAGWNSNLNDTDNLNSGVTFGIWREAGWLIDMFQAGHVALIFNAIGGDNRAHDLSLMQLDQGNVNTLLNQSNRSGWGGRLARSAAGNVLSLTSTPNAFCFGPLGPAQGYNPNKVDNRDVLSVQNSREMGLFTSDLQNDQSAANSIAYQNRSARALSAYYNGLRAEQVSQAFDKIMDHESKIREFSEKINDRLQTVPLPHLIEALYSGVNGPDGPINAAPGSTTPRRVLTTGRQSLGEQIRNAYDVISSSDLVNPRVLSLEYPGWDTHKSQRVVPSTFATDPDNPDFNSYRGIETSLKSIFGGQYGINPSHPNSLHGGFSALWQSVTSQVSRDKIVLTMAGEFGRQIRDNADRGTDHGRGNLMLVIGERCKGGIYGDMFQDVEVDKFSDPNLNTPDIDPKTEIDHFFAKVCDWVEPNSGSIVFPRTAITSTVTPMIEVPSMFDNLLY